MRRFYLFYIFSLVNVSKHRKRHMLEKSIRSQPRIWPLHISLTYTANLRVASDRTMDEIDVYSIEIIEFNHSADMRTVRLRKSGKLTSRHIFSHRMVPSFRISQTCFHVYRGFTLIYRRSPVYSYPSQSIQPSNGITWRSNQSTGLMNTHAPDGRTDAPSLCPQFVSQTASPRQGGRWWR